MNKATHVITFFTGAAIGFVAAWCYLDAKYKQIAQDEIDSVKEAFSKRKARSPVSTRVTSTKEKPSIVEYTARLREHRYTNYSDISAGNKKEVESEPMVKEKPYVIPPDEFGEFYDYETITLSYYADKVLADENDELVDDVDDVVGIETLSTFGEYEKDAVFVRNDRLKCDYEILLDQRKYSDVAVPVSTDEVGD